jgi:SAM-dependent methyltransferase
MALDLSAPRPPLPPLDLIDRVVRPFGVEEADWVREGFDTYPLVQLRALERALALVGCEFADFRRLLDFGCGPGRYLRHLGPLAETTEIHGADIDAEAIAWLNATLPYGTYTTLAPIPPSTFDDATFDLIINHSVFTHLGEDTQDAWLAELRRITAPGAILLLTVHGTAEWAHTVEDVSAGDATIAARLHEQLRSEGIVFIRDDHFIGSVHPDFYHTTFHAPWYVLEHWGRWFDVIAYVVNGVDVQDLVILRRTDDDVRPEILRPAATPSHENDGATRGRSPLGRARDLLPRRRPIEPELAAALCDIRDQLKAQQDALTARERELDMLRVGIYEQGRRMSLIAHQLREDITRHTDSN